ncbi:MAG: hypothetical protein MUF21_11370 [Gemmatimonadaceae bacterium]|jgi:hypothetical protein|nr:hypothetical protein [Gemmatimonadaceae bacterium]
MRGRALTMAALAGAVLLACTEVSTDPQQIVSIAIDSLPATALVVGDTLRGATLQPTAVRVRVFNGAGDTIPDAPITALLADSIAQRALSITPARLVIARDTAASARVAFRAGPVQTGFVTFTAVRGVPRLAAVGTTRDSIFYDAGDTTLRGAAVRAGVRLPAAGDTTVPVGGFRVLFTVVRTPPQLDSAVLVGATGRRVTGTIADGGGLAVVRLRAFARQGATGRDSVVVQARLVALGADVPGSPLTLSVPVRAIP